MSTRTLAARLSGFVTFLLLGVVAAPAQAQQPAPQATPEIGQENLETFAEAYLDIADVRMEMQARMQAVQDPEEANQLQQEASARMQEILEEHEISVQEYQEITQVLNNDPQQRQEFEDIVAELQEEEESSDG